MKHHYLTLLFLTSAATLSAQDFKLNSSGYFESEGVNVMSFDDFYPEGHQGGVSILMNGNRIATNGDIRFEATPGQWQPVPKKLGREVDGNVITTTLCFPDSSRHLTGFNPMYYPDLMLNYKVRVETKGQEVFVSVDLDQPIPERFLGKVGFNLEFFPGFLFGKPWIMDNESGIFPQQPNGPVATTATNLRHVWDYRPENGTSVVDFKRFLGADIDENGISSKYSPIIADDYIAEPYAVGKVFTSCPDDPLSRITIESTCGADLKLYDGRMNHNNGWFVLRSEIPAGVTKNAISWVIRPNIAKGWMYKPVIQTSQVGYLPTQPKVAVIELDKMDKVLADASVYKVSEGKNEKVFTGAVAEWGRYYKYNYVRFDFSSLSEPGVYYIQYGDTKTENFIIGDKVYDKIGDATSDVWIPIHMNHMTVNEAYRIWHGEPFKEGYLQAPAHTDHFDLHSQGVIDTKYKPLELIPGLNVGGYFDAGDYDIETGSNISVVQNMVNIWEKFHPQRDETFVSQEQRYVDLHRPDGKPDMLQYIEHGVLNLIAQSENIGHMAQCLSNSVLDNYHHLGDISAITDGLHYDPSLKPYEVSADGKSSGTPDDMWAFTTRNPDLDFRAATMFAAASRVLRGYNDDLAERALSESKRLQSEARELMRGTTKEQEDLDNLAMILSAHPHLARGIISEMATNLQLYIATGEKQYIKTFEKQIWPALDHQLTNVIANALDAIPYMDAKYQKKLRPYIIKYKDYLDGLEKNNPYGVPVGLSNWAGNGGVIQFGQNVCQASYYFPDVIDKSYAFKVAAWLYGCHPYHNYSFVATVGATRPKNVFYGNNRADLSFIPGNVAPGVLFRKPDHFENYDDWPFLWGENEGTIANNTSYLNFCHALQNLIKK